MTVRRYRSVEEMPAPKPLPRLDAENLRIACELTELAFGMRPWHREPGVRRYVSVEAARRAREEWELRQVQKSVREGSGRD